MKRFLLPILLIALSVTISNAQFSFENQNGILSTTNVNSGAPVIVMDMNGDNLDDIVRLDDADEVLVEFQQEDGSFTFIDYGSAISVWGVCAADIDSDGNREIILGGAYNGTKVLKLNAGGTAYVLDTLPDSDIFTQATAFTDVDNDGDVDYFACHDDGPSALWINDGSGGMTLNTTQVSIDLATTVPTGDGSGNYGVIWTDYDNDGDVDCYISHCRQGASSFTDPRRINQLYINDGNNNYSQDFADVAGLRIGAQTWTADFADYDNDGDFDCFMTNHDVESQFFRNDNGVFTDITAATGIDIDGIPIQAKMEDFDNDGFVDLLVSGSNEALFKNNGNGTFSEWSGKFMQGDDLHTFALGDLNHDGLIDVYGGFGSGFNGPGIVDDGLFINEINNDNNYYNINLQGVVSNRDALGAKVRLYGAWGMQTREVRAGESYGIANTLTCHFGIGTATSIDSVVIEWPKTPNQVIVNPGINQTAFVIENTCVSPNASIVNPAGGLVLCGGSSISLSAPAGLTYNWSNGASAQMITVNAPSVYSVEVSDGSACTSFAAAIILESPDETPSISVSGDLKFCEGNAITLTSSNAITYEWSTSPNDNNQSLQITESGSYSVTIQGTCQDFTSANIDVEVLPSPDAVIANDMTTTNPGTITLNASGNNVSWYDNATSILPIGTGNSFTTPATAISTTYTYYAEDINETPGDIFFGGIIQHEGTSLYSSDNDDNWFIGFDVNENSTLKSVVVYTDTPGPREIELKDDNGTVLQSEPVNLATGANTLVLNFDLTVGTGFRLTTNETVNQTNLGFEGPRLRRTNGANGQTIVSFPYNINGIVELNDYPYNDYYYYFYNWELQEENFVCSSDREEVLAIFNLDPPADDDNDGLTNNEEIINNTDPNDPDSDNDGIEDGEEVNVLGTNPNIADTDNDGFEDLEEVNYGSDPLDPLDFPSAIRDLNNSLIASLVPNPVKETLFVSIIAEVNDEVITTIYNSLGQVVLTDYASSDNFTIDVSDLSAEVYFVTVQMGDQILRSKIVKE